MGARRRRRATCTTRSRARRSRSSTTTTTLEFAMRTEARVYGFDDMTYTRELAFIRTNDNPTVGEFRQMTSEQRREMFWGSDRQDFYMWFTWKVLGKPEHLYHEGYNC